jgi:4,4'-diaponeurosporenoate glycosyltransferase
MDFDQVSLNLIIHVVLWLLGFFFLFRIFSCSVGYEKKTRHAGVSIIVPARNEERNLPNLLQSLNRQLGPEDEVLVVDDYSEDNTQKVAQANGVEVLQPGPAPAGWIGKTWACFQGAKIASRDIVVFLDADTVLQKDGLNKIVVEYLKRDGVLSIQPYHRMGNLYEQFSAFFNIVMMAASGAFTVLGKWIRPMGLFGPVLVMKRQSYIASGGHEKVKGELLEDISLGTLLERQGFKIYCFGGKGTISFRMYPNGIKDLVNGWSKGFALGAIKTSIPILILVVAWISGTIGVSRALIEAVIAANITQIAIWGGLYILYSVQIYWMLIRVGNFGFYTALFYPVPLTFFVFVFIYSFILIFIKKTVGWKGREIDLKHKVNK